MTFRLSLREIQAIRIDLYLADMRDLRPDLHAVLKILAGQIGCGVADLERVVARVAQRQDGLRLHRFGHGAGAGALARENVARHFLTCAVQQAEDRVEIRRRGGGRLDLDGDVGRLIQMEARAMRFAGLRKRAFERAGNLENGGFRSGAVRFDRAAACRLCRPAWRVEFKRVASRRRVQLRSSQPRSFPDTSSCGSAPGAIFNS